MARNIARLAAVAITACSAGSWAFAQPNDSGPWPAERARASAADDAPPALPGLATFDRRRAYVSSIRDGTISAVDLVKNEIAWTVQISEGAAERPAESAMGIAASPDGKWVYTGDAARNEVVFVNADEQRIVERISVPHQVHAIDICERGHVLWVSGQHPEYPWLSRSTIIDAPTRKIVKTFMPGLGNDAHHAFTPDASEIWGASVTTNLVSVYDAHSGEVLAAIPLYVEIEGTSPEAELGLPGFNEVAMTPDGTRAYVVGPESGTVFTIDVRTREPLARVKVGDRTHGVAVTRDGREVWTANNAGTVTILDAASLDILETIRVHDFANDTPFAHLAFSYDGTRAYVSFASDLAVIDVMTRELVARIEMGADPHEISLEDYYVGLPAGQRVTPERDVSGAVTQPEAEAEERSSEESNAAGITVEASLTSIEPTSTGERVLSFAVAADTHSGDLMEIDMAGSVSVLVDGEPVDARARWIGESETAHHRTGTLEVSVDVAPEHSVDLILGDIGIDRRTLSFETARDGER